MPTYSLIKPDPRERIKALYETANPGQNSRSIPTGIQYTTLPGIRDSVIAEFSAEFRLERGSAELYRLARFGMENHTKADFP